MSRNNDVYRVLVPKNNLAVLPTGQTLDGLAVGQVGVFDANTKLSLNAANVAASREIFLAVGIDTDGDNQVDDIAVSGGQLIQGNNIKYYNVKAHTASQPMIVDIQDFKADCDTSYGVKLEFRNSRIYRLQGSNQYTKTYAVKTACCDDCADCGAGDRNEIVKLMIDAITIDSSKLVIPTAIATTTITTATHGTSQDYAIGDVVLASDLDAMIAYNATQTTDATRVFTKLRLTTVPTAVNKYCNINLKYYSNRQTFIIPSLVDGFGCSGKIVTVQEYRAEEGAGYDIRNKEYISGGWHNSPGPYRTSELAGFEYGVFDYQSDNAVNYNQIFLSYDQESVGGWQEYKNNITTIVAIPTSDTVTSAGLLAVLDAYVGPKGFDALADDLASASTDDSVVEPSVSDINDPAADTIG